MPPPSTTQQIHVGTTGWSHPGWKGVFYPIDLLPHDYLSHYARHFDCVEIDSTFYQIPSIQLTQSWNERTPSHFLFLPKIPRSISHEAGLHDCQSEITLFLQSLGPIHSKLGRILLQLPLPFHPRQEALSLKKFILSWPESFPLSIEFQNPAWAKSRIANLLKDKNIPWCWVDMTAPGDKMFAALELHPRTSHDLHVRLLGNHPPKRPQKENTHTTPDKIIRDRHPMLEQWAMTLRHHLATGHRAFCLVNNHYEGFAPESCVRLMNLLGIPPLWPFVPSPIMDKQLKLPGT
ncbi:DUF72 domain-containing protein [Kamptonema cortianum]|nr:DUF72 domain-containing protein [Oscillatoria laete-virens]MDK3156470.1 DUF72 domain-containing protein [Kamptonema cortianum]MDL5053847.1 DUF72 domain-containing protein [Oscillatoria laete-virens NRMC-F 0139]